MKPPVLTFKLAERPPLRHWSLLFLTSYIRDKWTFWKKKETRLCCLSVYTKRINRDKKNRKVRCPVPDPQSLLSSVHTFPRVERRFLRSQHWGVWLLRQSTSPTLGLCESLASGISRSVQRLGARHLKKVKFIVKMSMLTLIWKNLIHTAAHNSG